MGAYALQNKEQGWVEVRGGGTSINVNIAK